MNSQNIQPYLQSELVSLHKATVAVRKSPRGRPVHQLRVSSRKLRAILPLLHDRADPSVQAELRSLKRIARVAAEERELEVAQKDAFRYRVRLKGLERKKRSAQKKILRTVKKRRYRKLSQKIRRIVKAVSHKIPAAGWKKMERRLRHWLIRPVRTSADFHALRIVVKKARYALEAAGKNGGELRALQDSLGRAHDLAVLEKMAPASSRVRKARKEFERRSLERRGPAIRSALRSIKS